MRRSTRNFLIELGERVAVQLACEAAKAVVRSVAEPRRETGGGLDLFGVEDPPAVQRCKQVRRAPSEGSGLDLLGAAPL